MCVFCCGGGVNSAYGVVFVPGPGSSHYLVDSYLHHHATVISFGITTCNETRNERHNDYINQSDGRKGGLSKRR